MAEAYTTDCEGGCILAVVGSRKFDYAIGVVSVIGEVIQAHAPLIPLPASEQVGKWFFDSGTRDRNIALAKVCQCMVRIFSTSSTTYGSGWTLDQARALGKRTDSIELP